MLSQVIKAATPALKFILFMKIFPESLESVKCSAIQLCHIESSNRIKISLRLVVNDLVTLVFHHLLINLLPRKVQHKNVEEQRRDPSSDGIKLVTVSFVIQLDRIPKQVLGFDQILYFLFNFLHFLNELKIYIIK
jgi:hypothetical protein